MKTFESLWAELSEKAVSRPEGSGTVKALDAGVHAIGKKILEEAGDWFSCALSPLRTISRFLDTR